MSFIQSILVALILIAAPQFLPAVEASKQADQIKEEKLTDEETAMVSAALMHSLAQLKVKRRPQR